MSDIELVILDMAGTTIEDTGQVPEAFTTVLRRHGIEITDEALRAVRGASKREAIRSLLERQSSGGNLDISSRTEQIFAEFRQCLAEIYTQSGVHAIPGATDTFARLRHRGVKVALNTGFDLAITNLIIHTLGWEKNTVDAIVCGDDVPQGRPAPYLIFRAMETTGVISVHRVANVGDTILDLQAGWNAAVRWNIGVLSGAHTKEQLERVEHTHLLPSVAALPSLWE
jgi:phosphonatase-like hydrolase